VPDTIPLAFKFQFGGESPLTARDWQTGAYPPFVPDTILLAFKFQFAAQCAVTVRDCQSGNYPIFQPDSKPFFPYRAVMFEFARWLATNCLPVHTGR